MIDYGLVSVIIVNWNGRGHLAKCLPSLFIQKYKNFELILVDNASTDNSVGYVKENFPKTKVVINDRNLGFAEANNIGYRASTGKNVLFLNNDTIVTSDFMVALLKALTKSETIGCVQSKILFMDDHSKLDSVGSYLTGTGFLYHKGFFGNEKRYSNQLTVFSAKGACMMFKREVLEAVKVEGEIFDSRFFAYFEETDLCHRVWLAGYKIIYAPKSIIYHKLGATSQKLSKPFVEYNSYKNRINSYIKNLGAWRLITILPLHLLICEIISFLFAFRGRFDIFLAIQKAIFWNIGSLGRTLKKRKYIQRKIRKLSDGEFFPKITKNQKVSYFLGLFLGWNVFKADAKEITK